MRALLIVDHGSRRAEANQVLVAVEAMLRAEGTFPIVHHAHMELAGPTIAEAFDRCVGDGATEIVVHPYFLGPGNHSRTDIPALVEAASQAHPQVRWRVTEPLGVHPKLCEIVLERAASEPAER
ncbi:MAG: hypothetical protein KC466_19245 [Myxococcales bacterium]|nr:hypothetical protein [Myxococcales bacterium]